MIIIIGLVASGKTTLYRKLNEEKTANAVEIELPQSCMNDNELKLQLFNLYYNNPNIDVIISHPVYLPNEFYSIISENDKIVFLNVPLNERKQRALIRSQNCQSNCKIFDDDFFNWEEELLKKFKGGNS